MSLTDVGRGKQIRAKLIRTFISADTTNVIVGTALVDMHCKSGYLNYAQRVFDLMSERNVVARTSIIMGYAVHGFADEGQVLFDSKRVSLHVLIDIGRLEEAWASMVEIEDKCTGGACSSGTIWAAMLGVCCLHGNVDMGMLVAKKMLE
ncbi:hypothetical protein LguiA_013296 [Lonicera macranthoides]